MHDKAEVIQKYKIPRSSCEIMGAVRPSCYGHWRCMIGNYCAEQDLAQGAGAFKLKIMSMRTVRPSGHREAQMIISAIFGVDKNLIQAIGRSRPSLFSSASVPNPVDSAFTLNLRFRI